MGQAQTTERKTIWTERAIRLMPHASLTLLAVQAAIPWLCGGRVLTQDGPSHVYNAVVLRELLLNPSSRYHEVYALNSLPVPNWLTYPILSLLEAAFGGVQAHNLMFSGLLVGAYFSYSYLVRVLSGGEFRHSPLLNAAANSWFLYMGFFNFVAGTALAMVAIAYWFAHAAAPKTRNYGWLGILLVLIYFSHVVPFGVTLLVFAAYSITHLRAGGRLPELTSLAAAAAPAAAIAGVYFLLASRDPASTNWHWESTLSGLLEPLRTRFFGGTIRFSGEFTLVPLVITSGVLLVLSARFLSPRQRAVALISVVLLLLGLASPSDPVIRSLAGERLYWTALLLALFTVAATNRSAIRILLESTALVLTILAAGDYVRECRAANPRLQRYLDLVATLPREAKFVRVADLASARREMRLAHFLFDPLIHLEDLPAASGELLNVSNYEPTERHFPVIYRTGLVPPSIQPQLHSLEAGCRADSMLALAQIPVRAQYAVALAGQSDMGQLIRCLKTGGYIDSAGSAGPPYARLLALPGTRQAH